MCPAMTAPPGSPGRGLPVYHPATAVVPGTCKVPPEVMPRWTSLVRTPIAGMRRLTGSATVRLAAGGGAAYVPWGIGTSFVGLTGGLTGAAALPVWLATDSPA